MDKYDQFKSLDNKSVSKTIDKNKIIYEGRLVEIGLNHPWCKCDARSREFRIRDTFHCNGCYKLHQYHCSRLTTEELIANDHFMSDLNFCLVCVPGAN